MKLLGGPESTDQSFCYGFSLKRVSKTIKLMTGFSKLHDPPCELLLLHYCAGDEVILCVGNLPFRLD